MSANRGKYAEGKIKDVLEDWKQRVAGFTYNRILDARSSLGAMSNPQPGDFQWFLNTGHEFDMGPAGWKVYTRNGLIESKEVFHEFRVPHKNFAPDQVGRMKIRQMAGSECIVITCHRQEGVRGALWRQVPLEVFAERPPGTASWDLTLYPGTPNLEDILIPYLS